MFNIIGKKNNQTSVSDADQEIPTVGSTDTVGNSVNLVSGIVRLHGLGFLGLHRKPMLDSIQDIESFLKPFYLPKPSSQFHGRCCSATLLSPASTLIRFLYFLELEIVSH